MSLLVPLYGLFMSADFLLLVTQWTIYFCSKFFTDRNLQYLEERSRKLRPASEIWNMDTPERAIAYEIMHVDMVGFKERSELPCKTQAANTNIWQSKT